jgi:hypothetical protein
MNEIRRVIETASPIFCCCLLAPLLLFTSYFFQFSVDDAFITFRYGHIFYKTGIWNWNADGALVEAYTNFLYAALSILPQPLGIPPNVFFKFLSICILAALVFVLHKFSDAKINFLMALALICLSPWFFVHLYSGLETPAFITLIFLLFLLIEKNANPKAVCFCVLLLPLTRPEGAVYAFVGIILYCVKARLHIYREPAFLCAVILGACYFVWRFWYFGYALPNTFYLKSVTGFSWQGIRHNMLEGVFYFLIAAGLCVVVPNRSLLLLALTSAAVFTLAYAPSSLMMNYADRFAFQVFFPVFLLATQVVKPEQWHRLVLIGGAVAAYACCHWTTLRQEAAWYADYFPKLIQSHKNLGVALSGFKDRHYSLMTPDAGVLPYYSEWKSYDSTGLADTYIAHRN